MAVRKGPAGGRVTAGDQMIPISRLHLSLSNPRHEPVDSEADAVARLCDDELIAELAQDIAQRGALSPLEVLGVMPMEGHPGHFVALEGNRRTCALIVLTDPERAPKKYQAQLKKLAQKTTVPRHIRAHVFADEVSAKPWIDLRHLGLQGGAGTKDWTPTQQLRAAGNNQKTSARANTLALLVLDRLAQRGLIGKDQRDEISLSTLTRYLGTPGVRAILGLGSSSELIYTHDHDEVDAALLRLAMDSIEPKADGSYRVHSRSDSAERLKYAHELKSRGFAPTVASKDPAPPPKATKAATTQATRSRSANHVDTSKYLLDRSFTVKLKDPVLSRLRAEALSLPLNEFPFAANYLLRAIVERIMWLFAKKHHRLQQRMSDEELTTACWKELERLGASKGVLTTIHQAVNRTQGHSLQSLGHAVHGGAIPVGKDLRARFHTWEPVLVEMLKHL